MNGAIADEGVSTHILLILLVVLLLVSGFFSAAETGMMAINRYRLKHDCKTNATARLVAKLLARSDQLLTIVLIGNSFSNVAIASIGTIIGLRVGGDFGAMIASAVLAVVILLFAEISPKIIASQKPEFVSYMSARPLYITTLLLYPLVWIASLLSNGMLILMGVKDTKKSLDLLTMDELRTVVNESSSLLPARHKSMLTSIFDLEHMTVNDIMIPRSEILGIDLEEDQQQILKHIRASQHTIMPVYQGDIDKIIGVLHMRDLSHQLTEHDFSKNLIQELVEKPYFIPEGTTLHTQLLNFQNNKNRFGLIVDEYGEIIGLVTLADILEEIVGEFTTDINQSLQIIPQADTSYLVDGGTNIRLINQTLGFNLPISESKTLSGMIIEHLGFIPQTSTCLLLDGYPIEVVRVQDNMIKTCKIWPAISNQHSESHV